MKFDHAQGLRSRDGGPLKRFEIAGADRKWFWGDAVIDGGHSVDLRDAAGELDGCAHDGHEDLGETMLGVVGVLRPGQGSQGRHRHDENGDAAGHHRGDGDRLTFHGRQIPQELGVEGFHGVTNSILLR